jgi:ectoine hydroxylase-related dioxygenase (phytanoyl-CoA dioxygenase family)
VKVLTDIIGPNVKMMQSMLFIKASGQPGQAWHQDEAHIPTRDRSLTAAWLALDDATTTAAYCCTARCPTAVRACAARWSTTT